MLFYFNQLPYLCLSFYLPAAYFLFYTICFLSCGLFFSSSPSAIPLSFYTICAMPNLSFYNPPSFYLCFCLSFRNFLFCLLSFSLFPPILYRAPFFSFSFICANSTLSILSQSLLFRSCVSGPVFIVLCYFCSCCCCMFGVLFNNHVVLYISWLGVGINNLYGFFLFACFAIQIVTGILLSLYYSSSSAISFSSIYYLSFDVSYGYIIRMLHVIGSFCCIYLLYAHFARSFYYSFNFSLLSHNFRAVYYSGLVILVLSLLVSFMGYCLV
jgi:hypothetical protein